MHLLLLAVGVLVTAVGAVMLGFSVPLVDPAGVALFTSGMTAVVGGLILLGLAVVVRGLGRIAERLDIQPLPLPPMVAIEREDLAPRAIRVAPEAPTAPVASPVASEAPAAARPSLLGWLGRPSAPSSTTLLAGSRTEAPRVAQAAAPQNGAQNASPAAPPVDLVILTRIPEPAREAPPVVAAPPPPIRPAPKPTPAPKPAVAANSTAATTVYRSGVIDGMAYSLFMDGSIEAELPTGKVRFATIDELQKYLVSKR